MENILKNNSAIEVCEKLYLNEELADVHFVFGVDVEMGKVPANKANLAVLSPVFKAMFYGSLPEKGDVQITDADTDGFKAFLQFFYLGEVTLTMENIETVARLADKYDVVQYVNACAAFLKSQLTIDNICWGYQLAMFLKNDELIEFCGDKISRSPKEIFATNSFQRCDKSTLKRILDLDLTCMETSVFDACLTWAKNACKSDDLDETNAVNLKTQLGDCLKQVRFNAMSIEEFTTFAMSYDGLFTPNEFQEIVFTLTVKGYESKLFNQNPRRFKCNENTILKCERVSVNGGSTYIKDTEVVWFTSNQTVLLGEICSAYTFDYSGTCYNVIANYGVNVTIAEIRNDFSQKILYEERFTKTWVGSRLKVFLTQPITIKPYIMYEVRFKSSMPDSHSYYNGTTWKPTVELANGLTIQFHRNPSHISYDSSTSGWIQSLGFNNL